MSETDPLARLAVAFGHRFTDERWLVLAVTHRSYANERHETMSPLGARDNERLEFLGDAVLGLAAAALLAERFPDADEGELTRRRAELVSGPTLARIARSLGVGEALRLGVGEQRTGGRDKPRLLAAALEACVGALYHDAGPLTAIEAARRLLDGAVDAVTGAPDPKSRLQERLQDEGRATPRYQTVAEAGPMHAREYEVVVRSGGETLGTGRGRSKAEAEREAARRALAALDCDRDGDAARTGVEPRSDVGGNHGPVPSGKEQGS
jgi:ribonuclease-3